MRLLLPVALLVALLCCSLPTASAQLSTGKNGCSGFDLSSSRYCAGFQGFAPSALGPTSYTPQLLQLFVSKSLTFPNVDNIRSAQDFDSLVMEAQILQNLDSLNNIYFRCPLSQRRAQFSLTFYCSWLVNANGTDCQKTDSSAALCKTTVKQMFQTARNGVSTDPSCAVSSDAQQKNLATLNAIESTYMGVDRLNSTAANCLDGSKAEASLKLCGWPTHDAACANGCADAACQAPSSPSSGDSSSGNTANSSAPSAKGTSGGLIAGIVATVVVLAAAGGLLFYRRRRSLSPTASGDMAAHQSGWTHIGNQPAALMSPPAHVELKPAASPLDFSSAGSSSKAGSPHLSSPLQTPLPQALAPSPQPIAAAPNPYVFLSQPPTDLNLPGMGGQHRKTFTSGLSALGETDDTDTIIPEDSASNVGINPAYRGSVLASVPPRTRVSMVFQDNGRTLPHGSSPLNGQAGADESTALSANQRPQRIYHSYLPKLQDELAIAPGDFVVVEVKFTDGWASGYKVTPSGQRLSDKGVFPIAALDPVRT
ncbi:hypothetical protein RI367_005484 [Sorochytrium milnesiophthora]